MDIDETSLSNSYNIFKYLSSSNQTEIEEKEIGKVNRKIMQNITKHGN